MRLHKGQRAEYAKPTETQKGKSGNSIVETNSFQEKVQNGNEGTQDYIGKVSQDKFHIENRKVLEMQKVKYKVMCLDVLLIDSFHR